MNTIDQKAAPGASKDVVPMSFDASQQAKSYCTVNRLVDSVTIPRPIRTPAVRGTAKNVMTSVPDYLVIETAFTAVQWIMVGPLTALAFSRAPEKATVIA